MISMNVPVKIMNVILANLTPKYIYSPKINEFYNKDGTVVQHIQINKYNVTY